MRRHALADQWIVIVDDDAMSLKNARTLLRDQNMRVSALRSGSDLLSFLQKNDPDLILLDIQMPEMDGFATYRKLREFEEKEDRLPTPVIFLTGDSDSETERRGLQAGASDFIRKPFNKEILVQRIQNIIANSKRIETLTAKATIDKLTGFLNKASGNIRIQEACKTGNGVLMIVDLDSFKLVNDLFGHEMGDKVLMAFADIVRHNTRSEDILCRIGGDEFLAFYRNAASEEAVAALIHRLNRELERVCKELMGEDHGIPIGASVGCVFVPEHGIDLEWLFGLADKALYQVKMNGKHGYQVYDPAKENGEEEAGDLDRELARITQVIEERTRGSGAMWLGLDSITWIYRYLLRHMERYKESVIKMIFQVRVEGEDKPLAETVALFGEVLQKTLRRSDILFQCKKDQFFLLLPELSEENIQILVDRIMRKWESTGEGDGVTVLYSAEKVEG